MRACWRAIVTMAMTVCGCLPGLSFAEVPQVTLAGLAFAGDAATLQQRFPYSRRYEAELAKSSTNAYTRVKEALSQVSPRNIEVTTGQIDELKGRDQALVTSLVVSSETVSIEQFGGLRKLFVLIRGQALFFDFKSMTVVRSYPLSFAFIDVFDRQPTEREVLERVRSIYEGTATKPGLFARFANVLATATLPAQVPRFVKVSKVTLSDDVTAALPTYLKSASGVADTWAADLVGEAISSRVGIPIVPYTQGYATGNVMPLRVSDGEVYTLKLPSPDYEISVDLTGVKKVKFGEAAAGTSYVYGTYARVKIEEPLSATVYMDAAFKNGEVKVVPATQTYVDDFPAYYDSVNGLFKKLAGAMSGESDSWLKSATSAPDITNQISKTQTLLNSCK